MSYQVVMPRLGLTMTEAKIVEWLKSEGAWVEKGQPLFVIENEKATLDIESPSSGRLHITAQAGETIPILQPVATLEGGADAAAHHQTAAPAGQAKPTVVTAASAPPVEPGGRTAASPRARSLARRLNVDLRGLAGTGVRGMLTAADVQAAAPRPVLASPLARRVAAENGMPLERLAGSGPHGWVMRRDVEQALAEAPAAPEPQGEILPLEGLRAMIADRLGRSWVERPQVTLTTDADASHLVAARRQLNAELEPRGQKVSFNALLVKLAAQALAEHPALNAQMDGKTIRRMAQVHIGVAVDTPRGLLVPVVRDAGRKTLGQVNADLEGLVRRALEGRSLPDDLSGGTFTLTNLGMYDIDAFTPLINPPECAILGIGRIVERPVGLNGQIVLREMMALSLSFDHRLVDGAPAARFLQRVRQLIERPFALALAGW